VDYSELANRIKRARGLLPPDRSVELRPDDVMLVSYPRSGNTWMRFLLSNLRTPDSPATLDNLDRRIPGIYFTPSREIARMPSPRIIKSHEYFDPRYRKTIYVVRDPRDVAVSYYYYELRMGRADTSGVDEFAKSFVLDRVGARWWGTWAEHVGSWLGARQGADDFLLVRYEDLRANAFVETQRIAGFLGLGADRERAERAIAASSFDSMQVSEQTAGARRMDSQPAANEAIPFVRKGEVGSGREALSAESQRLIEETWAPQLAQLGYTANVAQGTSI
jgi:hypothetical protein